MQGRGLINEFADLINKSYLHCNNRTKNKLKCEDCAFHWNYNIRNHGCFLVEMEQLHIIENLRDAMNYHIMDTSKIDNLELTGEEYD